MRLNKFGISKIKKLNLDHVAFGWLEDVGLSPKEKSEVLGLAMVNDNLKTGLLIQTDKIKPTTISEAIGLVYNFTT